MKPAYSYLCEILEWIDGDTVRVRIDLGFKISIVESVRVYGINAPELHSRDAEERERAKIAKTCAGVLARADTSGLSAYRTITVEVMRTDTDHYTTLVRGTLRLVW